MGAFPEKRPQLTGDEVGLLNVVVRLEDGDGLARAALRPELPLHALLVAGDDSVSGVQDILGRAVVLFQIHHLGVWIVSLEVEDVADIGGAPGVDRLVRVAHDADVAVAAGKLPRQHVLGHVSVLELIDERVEVALLVLLAHGIVLPEERHRAHDQVVEIESVVLLQQPLVALVGAGDHLAEVVAHGGGIGSGGSELALGARDGGEHGPRGEPLRVHHQLLQHPAHERLLITVVVDGKAALDAGGAAVAPQDAGADGVEGAERDAFGHVAQEGDDTVAHLARRLIREGDGDDAIGVNVLMGDEVGDAVRDDARFAAARPGQDQQRALGVLDGILLGGIKVAQDLHGVPSAGSGEPLRA